MITTQFGMSAFKFWHDGNKWQTRRIHPKPITDEQIEDDEIAFNGTSALIADLTQQYGTWLKSGEVEIKPSMYAEDDSNGYHQTVAESDSDEVGMDQAIQTLLVNTDSFNRRAILERDIQEG